MVTREERVELGKIEVEIRELYRDILLSEFNPRFDTFIRFGEFSPKFEFIKLLIDNNNVEENKSLLISTLKDFIDYLEK